MPLRSTFMANHFDVNVTQRITSSKWKRHNITTFNAHLVKPVSNLPATKTTRKESWEKQEKPITTSMFHRYRHLIKMYLYLLNYIHKTCVYIISQTNFTVNSCLSCLWNCELYKQSKKQKTKLLWHNNHLHNYHNVIPIKLDTKYINEFNRN